MHALDAVTRMREWHRDLSHRALVLEEQAADLRREADAVLEEIRKVKAEVAYVTEHGQS